MAAVTACAMGYDDKLLGRPASFLFAAVRGPYMDQATDATKRSSALLTVAAILALLNARRSEVWR